MHFHSTLKGACDGINRADDPEDSWGRVTSPTLRSIECAAKPVAYGGVFFTDYRTSSAGNPIVTGSGSPVCGRSSSAAAAGREQRGASEQAVILPVGHRLRNGFSAELRADRHREAHPLAYHGERRNASSSSIAAAARMAED